MSPDGRRLACTNENDVVEVWNACPGPRWPTALGAGLIAAAGVLTLDGMRRRFIRLGTSRDEGSQASTPPIHSS
jgi:hypothetical protein